MVYLAPIQIGTRVQNACQLNGGDIVAIADHFQEGTIFIRVVDHVQDNNTAKLKRSYLALVLGYGTIHTYAAVVPAKGELCITAWPEFESDRSQRGRKPGSKAYRVTDELFIALGRLEPKIEAYEWAFGRVSADFLGLLIEFTTALAADAPNTTDLYQQLRERCQGPS